MKLLQLKTALIGAGNMGAFHARVYSEISQFIAVAEINPILRKEISSKYKVRVYEDYKEMIEKESIDALSVVVPTPFHAQVAIDCLKKKIPVLLEKPISDTIQSAHELVTVSQDNNVLLKIGHIERYNPCVQKLKQLIEEDKLGTILNLHAMRMGISPPSTRGSNVGLDLGIHDIDIFNYLLDTYPVSYNVDDQRFFEHTKSDSVAITLKYLSQLGVILANWITPIKIRKLYVSGTKGFAEVDYISQQVTLYNRHIQLNTDGDFLKLVSLSDIPKKEIFITKKEPLREELIDFLKQVQNGEKVDAGLQSAVASLEIVIKAYDAKQ
ncbi:MAG: Gfo/Idh/MocA family oxidoreductase [Candidatus Roizmanbacteria bacterium]